MKKGRKDLSEILQDSKLQPLLVKIAVLTDRFDRLEEKTKEIEQSAARYYENGKEDQKATLPLVLHALSLSLGALLELSKKTPAPQEHLDERIGEALRQLKRLGDMQLGKSEELDTQFGRMNEAIRRLVETLQERGARVPPGPEPTSAAGSPGPADAHTPSSAASAGTEERAAGPHSEQTGSIKIEPEVHAAEQFNPQAFGHAGSATGQQSGRATDDGNPATTGHEVEIVIDEDGWKPLGGVKQFFSRFKRKK